MLEALGEWMSQPFYYSVYGGQPARRTGARHALHRPVRPVCACSDGSQMFIGLQNDREWAVLCEQVLHRPDLISDRRFRTNPDRVAHDSELTAIIEAALESVAVRSARRELLDEAGIASARLRIARGIHAYHPQLEARGPVKAQVDSAGPGARAAASRHRARPRAVMGAIPALGQHTSRHPGPSSS